MTYVIGEACIDVLDKTCMDVCPVDCIYTGVRKNYINPSECINCGSCVDACPVEAIYADAEIGVDDGLRRHHEDNRRFFEDVLDGLGKPVGNPGGAIIRGHIGADTALVTLHQ